MASQSQHPTPLSSPSHPPPTASPPSPPLSPRESIYLSYIFLCIKGADLSRLQFDWDALASRIGMSNPRSAANAWITVKKKITSTSASSSSPPKLTPNDNRFLANAVYCSKRPLDIDYPALAAKLGMRNPRSAVNAWTAIKKKIAAAAADDEDDDGDNPAGGGVEKKKAVVKVGTPRARSKAVARMKAQGGTGAELVASPTSRTLDFKVNKQHEVISEGRSAEYSEDHQQQFVKPDPQSVVQGMSSFLELNAAKDMGYAMTDDRVMVKSEVFDDEC